MLKESHNAKRETLHSNIKLEFKQEVIENIFKHSMCCSIYFENVFYKEL